MDKPWSEDLYNKRKQTQAEEIRYLKEIIAKQIVANPTLADGIKPIEAKQNSIAHAKNLRLELGKYPIFSKMSRADLMTHCPLNHFNPDSVAAFPGLSLDEGYHFCNYDEYTPDQVEKSIKNYFLSEYERLGRSTDNLSSELRDLTTVSQIPHIRFPIVQLMEEKDDSDNVYYDPVDRLVVGPTETPPCKFVFFKIGEQMEQDTELSAVSTSMCEENDMMAILSTFLANCSQWRYGPAEMKRFLKTIIHKKRLQLGVPISDKHSVEDMIMLILQNTRKILPHEKALRELTKFKRGPGERMANCIQRIISLYKISKKKPDISADPLEEKFNDQLYEYAFEAMAKLQPNIVQRRDTLKLLKSRNPTDRAIWPRVMEFADIVDENEAKYHIRLTQPIYLYNHNSSEPINLNNIWDEGEPFWETPSDLYDTENGQENLSIAQRAAIGRQRRASKVNLKPEFAQRRLAMRNRPKTNVAPGQLATNLDSLGLEPNHPDEDGSDFLSLDPTLLASYDLMGRGLNSTPKGDKTEDTETEIDISRIPIAKCYTHYSGKNFIQ